MTFSVCTEYSMLTCGYLKTAPQDTSFFWSVKIQTQFCPDSSYTAGSLEPLCEGVICAVATSCTHSVSAFWMTAEQTCQSAKHASNTPDVS